MKRLQVTLFALVGGLFLAASLIFMGTIILACTPLILVYCAFADQKWIDEIAVKTDKKLDTLTGTEEWKKEHDKLFPDEED